MSHEGLQSGTKWEQRVRLFGLIVIAVPHTLIGCGLMFTFVGDWAGVGLVQRVAIGLALAVLLLGIAIGRREPPQGRRLVVMRRAFFTTYAAVLVAAFLKVPDENFEILSIPIYSSLIFSLHAFYERCVQPTASWGKR